MMQKKKIDTQVRMAAFNWLSEQVGRNGDVFPRKTLAKGFIFKGQQVRLMGPQGIFKPKILPEIPLSITTSPHGPYDDSFGLDNLLLYRYRGTNPYHHENVGLRKAYQYRIPLIYFHGIVPGKYLALWPVYIVDDMPERLSFKVASTTLHIPRNAMGLPVAYGTLRIRSEGAISPRWCETGCTSVDSGKESYRHTGISAPSAAFSIVNCWTRLTLFQTTNRVVSRL